MLISILCIYIAIWACAYWAAQQPGRLRFVVFYVAAALLVPNLAGLGFWWVYQRADPENADQLAALVVVLGMALGLIAYPLVYIRTRR